MWRTYVAGGNVAEIRNASTLKLHVIGDCEQDNFSFGPGYIDGSQPGAFDVTLYPSEERQIGIAGDIWASQSTSN
jgi:hypothetical protein